MWIYAPAGAGKSAIAQTVAERDDMEGILCGFFAFSRSSSGLDTADFLIPTLAYQLALYIPETKTHIIEAVEQDPQIFSRSVESQMRHLIFDPLLHAEIDDSSKQQPQCIIIDGLDECKDPQIQSIIIQSIVKNLSESFTRIQFLIFSRPELEIRNTFSKNDISRCCVHLELDERFKPDRDIELFFRDQFEEIKQNHPSLRLCRSYWPTNKDIMHLVGKSSGQFIYAATVLRFINNPRSNPQHQLEVILNIRPTVPSINPYAELDALYMFILDQIQSLYVDISHIFMVIAWGQTGNVSNSMDFIMNFLELEQDIYILIADLHSIVKIPKEEDDMQVAFYHASFVDFLTHEIRSGIFYIDKLDANGYLAMKCFTHMIVSRTNKEYNVKHYSRLYSFYHILESNESCIQGIQDAFGPNCIVEQLRCVLHVYYDDDDQFIKFHSYLMIGNATIDFLIQHRKDLRHTVNNEADSTDVPGNDYTLTFRLFPLNGLDFEVGTTASMGMKNLIHSCLVQLYDEEEEGKEEFGCRLFTDVAVDEYVRVQRLCKSTSYHSVCLLNIVEWLLKASHINIHIDVYFHILRLFFTRQASPSKQLGRHLRVQKMDLMETLRRFNLQEWRIRKLQIYMDDFLQKCNYAKDEDVRWDYISWISYSDPNGEEYADEEDEELNEYDDKYTDGKSEVSNDELAEGIHELDQEYFEDQMAKQTSEAPCLIEEGLDCISQHASKSISSRDLKGSGTSVEEWQSGQSESQSYVNTMLTVSDSSNLPLAPAHTVRTDPTQAFSTLDLLQIDPWGVHDNEVYLTSNPISGNL